MNFNHPVYRYATFVNLVFGAFFVYAGSVTSNFWMGLGGAVAIILNVIARIEMIAQMRDDGVEDIKVL